MQSERISQLRAEREILWAAFMENGGRGVELAERIDEIDAAWEAFIRSGALGDGPAARDPFSLDPEAE